MLKFLRKKEVIKKIMWGLALLIIPAFILWGSGSAIKSRGQPKYAGKIFGRHITFGQYEDSFLACRNQALLIYGDNFHQLAQYLNLEQQAWERLILLHQANKQKIEVSNQEVVQSVQKMPLFQKQGRFDKTLYQTLLNYAFRVNAREFEEQIREILKIDKLKESIVSQVKLSDQEIKQAYREEKEKAQVWYVLIEAGQFAEQVHPAYEQLQEYYQNHKNEFQKPEQVNVQYLALYFDQGHPQIEVSEEEITTFYQEHSGEFTVKDKKETVKPLAEVQEQIKERLIQEKLRQKLEDRIWDISDQIASEPEDFAEIAKRNQLEIKETGFFGPQKVIPEIGLSYEFLTAAFTMKSGEISDVIKTPKGFFIIKIREKKAPYIAALKEVKEEVGAALVKQESSQLAKRKAEEILAQIKNLLQQKNLQFPKAAEQLSLTVKQTEQFTRTSYISEIGQSQEFTQVAFKLKAGEVSNLIAVPNGYCILSLKEIIPIDEAEFLQQKEEFAKVVLAKKQNNFYKVWLYNLIQEAKLEDNIAQFKKQQAP